jgi:hypothetical protein
LKILLQDFRVWCVKEISPDAARTATDFGTGTMPAGIGGGPAREHAASSKNRRAGTPRFRLSSEALDPAQLQLLLQMPELKPVANPPAASVVEPPKPIVAVRKDRKAPRLP